MEQSSPQAPPATAQSQEVMAQLLNAYACLVGKARSCGLNYYDKQALKQIEKVWDWNKDIDGFKAIKEMPVSSNAFTPLGYVQMMAQWGNVDGFFVQIELSGAVNQDLDKMGDLISVFQKYPIDTIINTGETKETKNVKIHPVNIFKAINAYVRGEIRGGDVNYVAIICPNVEGYAPFVCVHLAYLYYALDKERKERNWARVQQTQAPTLSGYEFQEQASQSDKFWQDNRAAFVANGVLSPEASQNRVEDVPLTAANKDIEVAGVPNPATPVQAPTSNPAPPATNAGELMVKIAVNEGVPSFYHFNSNIREV